MIRLFRVSFPPAILALFVIEAALAFTSYLLAFQILFPGDWALWLLYEGGFDRISLAVLSILLGVYFNDLYSDVRVSSRVYLAQKYCLVYGIAFMSQALLSYVSPSLILGRWQMILGSGMGLMILPLWRMAFDSLVLQVLPSRSILFIGANELVRSLASELRARPQFAMASKGYLAEQELSTPSDGLGPYLGAPSELKKVAEQHKPELIVVGLAERRNHLPVYDLLDLRMAGIKIEEITTLYETVTWRVPIQSIRPSQMLFAGELGPSPNSILFQQMYSFAMALAGVVVTAPLMLLIWVLIRLSSPGPAIWSQSRAGLHGKVFQLLQFRCTHLDPEAHAGAAWPVNDDPRLTPVGKWLRRLRLDQLPQFFNVLKGDMAIVGPRPERPEFARVLSERIPFYRLRQHVRPGMTGWAQINQKHGETIQDTLAKLEYDLYYLKNAGLSLDLYVIFNSARVILRDLGRRAG